MTGRRTRAGIVAAALALLLAGAGCTQEIRVPVRGPGSGSGVGGGPDVIVLPPGFGPEGVAVDDAGRAYFGSRQDGKIFRASLTTGEGQVLAPGPGTPSLGLALDGAGRLFVAGGRAGDARVIDTASGAVLASYPLATGPSFVNDVALAPGAAWFTDSTAPVLHRVPLGPDGAPAPPGSQGSVPLSGAIAYGPGINANGIETTPDGSGLLIVQSSTGLLFRVDPATGVTTPVDLGGATIDNGDGITRDGTTLYAVANRSNAVAVLELAPDGTSGRVTRTISDPRFDVPTTVAVVGNRLLLPNARFSLPVTPDTPYFAVLVPRG